MFVQGEATEPVKSAVITDIAAPAALALCILLLVNLICVLRMCARKYFRKGRKKVDYRTVEVGSSPEEEDMEENEPMM